MTPSPFRFRSVRARLTAITLLAFVLVVAVLASVSVVVSREAMKSSIDADLRRRGKDFAVEVGQRVDPDSGHRGSPPQDRQDGPPGDDGGPHDGGGPPGGGPGRASAPQRPNPDWIAPALISVGPERRGGDINSTPYDLDGYALARQGHENFTTAFVGGEPRRVFSVPVSKAGRVVNVIQVAYAMRPALESLDRMRWTLLFTIVPLGLLLGGLASVFVVNRLLKPLRHLNAEAIRIGRGGLGERLNSLGDDEFASLAHTLNGMVSHLEEGVRLEREVNARLLEGIERQRRFTGDASHELKTPLTVVKTYLGALKRSRRTVAEEAEAVGAMERAADRMNGLIGDLLTLARSDDGIAGSRTPCRLNEILREAADSVPGGAGRVRLRAEADVWVVGEFGELTRVFSNLIENAMKHSGTDEPIAVELAVADSMAVVTVADRGVGIAPEHLPHLFERFYRADKSRSSTTGGNGLGLAICESVVEGHGGSIDVESAVGKGAVFTVRLPLRETPTGPALRDLHAK